MSTNPRVTVIRHLRKLGYYLEDKDINTNRREARPYRWSAFLQTPRGNTVLTGSYDTLTACAEHGVRLAIGQDGDAINLCIAADIPGI